MLLVSVKNGEMLFMNNIELAPHNYGRTGKFDRIAGCLIAFACSLSFELGKNHYKGFLTFDSKTELIALYQNKYGATLAMGHRMFIDNVTGEKLIKEYLGVFF